MSIQPLITFKAGKCELDTSSRPAKVKAVATPGYIYLHIADELVHFCWRPRSAPVSEPEIDLLMIPGDGNFVPYEGQEQSSSDNNRTSPTNGRIYVLKFQSSSQRHLFWLQSKSQHPEGNPNWFSPRDLKLGEIVDSLLGGEEVDVAEELRELRNTHGPGRPDDDDPMEDVEGSSQPRNRDRHGSTGGAGPGATGGDIREEGEESREGGADGGRAAAPSSNDASTIVQNFLKSLEQGGSMGGSMGGASSSQQGGEKPFTTLPDLLPSSETIPLIDNAPESLIEALSENLPPITLLLSQDIDDIEELDPNSETAQAIIQSLTVDQKREVLRKVLRSPQLHQSLGSLTMALRDGGLPTISEALKIKVDNGGYIRQGAMPMGGGEAVEAFLEGVKKTVQEEDAAKGDDKMETD